MVLDYFIDMKSLILLLGEKKVHQMKFTGMNQRVVLQILLGKFSKVKTYFLSIFNPYYFPELSPKDAKALLSSVLKPVGRDEIFKELGDYLKQVLLDNELRITEKPS